MKSWANNPRYQRAMQKIAALRPEHRAILQTVTADPQFADEKMRQSIQSMITATRNKRRQRQFGLRKRSAAFNKDMIEHSNAMRERNISFDKKQGKKAFGLGVANLGLSTVGGIKQRKRDEKILAELKAMNNRYKTAGINTEINELDAAGGLGIDRFRNYKGPFPNWLGPEQ